MLKETYEQIVHFASEGDLAAELSRAKQEYCARTGELFESDPSFEQRIAGFLEWYSLDRPWNGASGKTPVQLFLDANEASMEHEDLERFQAFAGTTLSLFEFRRAKNDYLAVVDLLTNSKHDVHERRKLVGLAAGDILEARLVPYRGKLLFGEGFACHPREARKAIVKATKNYRSGKREETHDIDFVHRVAYLSNRCERYKHVSPKQIFEDL